MMKKYYYPMSVSIRLMVLTMVFCSMGMVTSCSTEDDTLSAEQQFENEMTAALADAQKYGPETDAIAREVAAHFDGCVTDINYKTRESATRKCITDNCRPYDLKDLARTTIVAGWDSTEIKPVITYLVQTATDRNSFGRYKHQTSDYGYWGDIVNLQYDKLMTEVQVKTYGMFYAVQPEDIARSVLGDSLYNFIHTKTGVEPGMSHHYYEIMRADTSSAATVERYRQLSIEYYEHFEHIKDPEPARTYYMTVDASKGANEATSRFHRALSLDGKTLNASWGIGEKVYVYAVTAIVPFWFDGSIQPQSAGANTRLTGQLSLPSGWEESISSLIGDHPEFTLQFPRSGTPNYAGQIGTLDDIAEKYDYAIATDVQFDIVEGDHIIGTNSAEFVNQQAIVKFTLMNKDTGDIFSNNPSKLTITYNSGSDPEETISLAAIPDATYSTNGNGVLYVAIPGFSGNITLSATVGSDTYTYSKSGVTFMNGNYYDITVKMTKQVL